METPVSYIESSRVSSFLADRPAGRSAGRHEGAAIHTAIPRPTLPAAPRPPRLRRWLYTTFVWFNLLPFLALHAAVLLVFYVPFSWTSFALFFGLFVLRTWGLTAGFHRYFSHRSYKTSRWFQFVIGCIGAGALQRGPMWWAGEHRQHHKYSDKDGDPHSPIVRSVWWSHIGWVLDRSNRLTKWEELKDFQKYPELRWLDRIHWGPGLLLTGLCYAIDGWSGVVWGMVLGTVCLYHTTFCVNSVCHLFGSRRYETTDLSRNNPVVAILTMGEGWHNNHHHYPSAARQGFKWYEVDASYYILKGLSAVGLVWDLREPTPRALAHKLIQK